MAPWAHLSPHPKRHLDCFSCFSTAHGYVQDTQTHTHRPSSIGNNTPHLCTLCIWLDLVITITQGEPNDATNVEKDLENTNSSEATATWGIYRSNESTTPIHVTASSLSSPQRLQLSTASCPLDLCIQERWLNHQLHLAIYQKLEVNSKSGWRMPLPEHADKCIMHTQMDKQPQNIMPPDSVMWGDIKMCLNNIGQQSSPL